MSIGFKEWVLVGDALGAGEQSIILRKGGIAEGREGFCFKHREFFLFPTLFHEQVEKLKLPSDATLPAHEDGIVRIDYYARIEWTSTLTHWDAVRSLDAFHIWHEEVIAERFNYDEAKCLHLAFVRVFRLVQPWSFPDQPAYGGCRSWVQLPEPPQSLEMMPVLDEAAHRQRAEHLRHVLREAAISEAQAY